MSKLNIVRIGDVCTLKSGKTIANHLETENGQIPYIKVSDMNIKENNKYIVTSNKFVNKGENFNINNVFPKGTVIFPKRGGAIGTNKKRLTSCEIFADLNIMGIIPNDKVFPEYLFYYFKSIDLATLSNGSSVPQINNGDIAPLQLPLPDITTQKNISLLLDKAEKLIDKRKEQIKAMDELVKSRFIEMFGNTNDYVSVSEYIESLTAGKSLAGESECLNKVLNTGSVSYDYYDETQVKNLPLDYLPKKEHLVNEGDVLISRMNTAELVGATAYVWKSKENIYIPDRLWKANFKPNVNPIFVWQLLIQRSTKEKIRKIASGTSGSMKNISKSGLLGIEVINVDIDKQNEFADFVKQVDKLKSQMETSLKELEDNFNSLMQKAFKGELF